MFFELLKDWNAKNAGERVAFAPADAARLASAGVIKAVSDHLLAPVIAKGLESALAGWTKGTALLENLANRQRESWQRLAAVQRLIDRQLMALAAGVDGRSNASIPNNHG